VWSSSLALFFWAKYPSMENLAVSALTFLLNSLIIKHTILNIW
jgi:hypothetical protein